MEAGIYFPLFLVLVEQEKAYMIYYLSADLQPETMFRPRKPLSSSARRAGWQGFLYDLSKCAPGAVVPLRGGRLGRRKV